MRCSEVSNPLRFHDLLNRVLVLNKRDVRIRGDSCNSNDHGPWNNLCYSALVLFKPYGFRVVTQGIGGVGGTHGLIVQLMCR
jgi:hypothetical protein